MEENTRTIAYVCPACRQPVIMERSLFQIAAGPMKLDCPCGRSAVRVDMQGAECVLTVPCAFCAADHAVTCASHAFFHEKTLAFSCGTSGLDCCYVGEEGAVFAAMRRLEEAMDHLEPESGGHGAFLNETVMHEVLSELKDMIGRGGVSCACGASALNVAVHYSSVDLSCGHCGAGMRVPAATVSDVEDLCCQTRLVLGKKAFREGRQERRG